MTSVRKFLFPIVSSKSFYRLFKIVLHPTLGTPGSQHTQALGSYTPNTKWQAQNFTVLATIMHFYSTDSGLVSSMTAQLSSLRCCRPGCKPWLANLASRQYLVIVDKNVQQVIQRQKIQFVTLKSENERAVKMIELMQDSCASGWGVSWGKYYCPLKWRVERRNVSYEEHTRICSQLLGESLFCFWSGFPGANFWRRAGKGVYQCPNSMVWDKEHR